MQKRKQRMTDGYIALMLAVFPFYIDGDYTTLSSGKYRLFLILCGGYTLSMLVLRLCGKERRPCRRMTAEYCAAAYVFLSMLSAAASPYDGVWLGNGRYEGVLSIGIYVLSFLFVSRWGRVKPWQLWLLGVSVGVYSLICILQLGGWNPLRLYPGELTYSDAGIAYNGAFIGTMGNAGLTGAWLSLSVPMLLAALIVLKGKKKWLLIIPLAVGAAVVTAMDVSAAIIGIVGSILFSVPVLLTGKKRKSAITATGILAFLGIAVLWICPFSGTAGELHAILHGTLSDQFGSGRIGIWRQFWQLVPEYWLLGSGPDTVAFLELIPFVGESEQGESILRLIDVAHNEYLQILICQGVFALAAYLGILFSLCCRWLTSKSKTAKILGCGILGYCMQAFFSFSMCIAAPLFWLALGLLNAEYIRDGSCEQEVCRMNFHAKNGTIALENGYMDYIRFGNGEKTLIVIPGLGDSLRSVKGTALPMAVFYRSFAKEYTVYFFSRKRPMPEGYTTEDMARDQMSAMEVLGIDKADYMGVSMGGMISQHLAANYPEKVGKLVLVVTAARANPIMISSVTEWIGQAGRGEHAALMDSNIRQMYSPEYYRKNKWLVPIAAKLSKPHSYQNFLIQANACLCHDAYDKLPMIRAATLVIGGEKDLTLGGEASREIAGRIDGAVLRMYAQWGHALYDEAKDFRQTVLDFLVRE